MHAQSPPRRAAALRRVLLWTSAAMGVALGISVMVGWHAHLPALTKLQPGFVAMRYNTALAFLLSGTAFACLALGRPRWAGWLGGVVLAVGLMTLLQYLTGLDFHIDELLMRDYDPLGTTSPGRMAPNTAFCFTILSAATILAAKRRPFRARPLLLSLVASVLVVLGALSIFGYASGVMRLSQWGRFTYMAVNTAAGMCVLGLGLFAFAWDEQLPEEAPFPTWLPVPFAMAMIVISLVVAQALKTQADLQLEEALRAEGEVFRQEVLADFDARFRAMGRMALRWQVAERAPTREEWESDATRYVVDQPGYQALEWVDEGDRVRWVVPRAGNEAVVDRDFSQDPVRRIPYDQARASGQPVVGPVIDLAQGGRGFVTCFPLRRDGKAAGFVVAVFRLGPWIQSVGHTSPRAAFTLSDSRGPFFEGGTAAPGSEALQEELGFAFEGRTWGLRVAPTDMLLAQVHSRLPVVVLGLGAGLAILVGLLIRFALEARLRAQRLAAEVHERQRVETVQRLILENSTMGVALVRQRTFVWANQRLADMVGLPMEGVVGASTRVIYPSDEAFEALGARAYPILAEGRVAEQDMEFARPDGSRFWCRLVGKAVDPRHYRDGSVWMFEDVTERRRTERLKREFVSTVSHELRTPLTSIRGSLALLAAGVGGELSEETRSMVDIALRNSVRLVSLVNDILDMEKVSSGRLEIRNAELDLGALVPQAMAQNEGYAASLGVALRLEAVPGELRVWADEERLLQVLANLLSNAVKFSPGGGSVDLRVIERNGFGRVEVEDRGPGIPEEFRDHIFQPFSQADASDARSKGGTGLGLTISKALVEAMGGRIGFESGPGGTTFFVDLRLASGVEPVSGAYPIVGA